MKKALSGQLLFAILLLTGIIYSCSKEKTSDAVLIQDEIIKAQNWYKQAYKIGSSQKNILSTETKDSTISDFSKQIIPDWNKGVMYQRQGKEIIELPLDSAADLGITVLAPIANSIKYNKLANKPVNKFLIMHDEVGYHAFIMTVIPNADWAINNDNQLKHISYRNKPNNFTGKVLYFTPKGELVNGYVYKSGKIVRKIGSAKPLTNRQQIAAYFNSANKSVLTETCFYDYNLAFTYSEIGTDQYGNDVVVDHYTLYIYESCYSAGDQPIGDDNQGGGFGTVNTTTQQVTEQKPLSEDPCKEKGKLNARATKAVVSAQSSALFGKTTTSNYEWGTEQRVQTLTPFDFIPSAIRTDNSTNSLAVNFTWNSFDGYTIGFIHDHPSATAPSPDDVFDLIKSYHNAQLQNSSVQDKEFYKANASLTVVTAENNYMVTVRDWDKLDQLYGQYLANPTKFEQDFLAENNKYESYEVALMKVFSDAINLYSNGEPNSTDYVPLTISDENKPIEKPCPTN